MYERYCILRDGRSLKDSVIASALGITPSTFSDWKKGKSQPNVDKLVKIARYLGTSVEYLVTGESTEPLPPVPLSSKQEAILQAFDALNDEGQKKVADYIEDLGEKYKKDTPSTGMIAG